MKKIRFAFIVSFTLTTLAGAQIDHPLAPLRKDAKSKRSDHPVDVRSDYRPREKQFDFDPILGAQFQVFLDSMPVLHTVCLGFAPPTRF